MASSARHDIILYGATGFTGGLVAEYLAQTIEPGTVSWALAGRDPRKLRRVREGLATINRAWAELPLYQGQSSNEQSMHDLAARARVVLTTVGPYAGRGESLVAACVAEGSDYVDLTGEPAFWRGVIDRHHEEASAKGLRLVPCCGFDSIPHDLGAWWTAQQLPGRGPLRIDGYVAASGGMSGGTWSSLLGAMAKLRDTDAGRSPASKRSGDGRPKSSRLGIHYAQAVGRWVTPMPTIDPLVVKRSAQFTDVFGPEFRYQHYLSNASKRQLAQRLAGVGTLFALAQTPARHWLRRLRPSGAGPSEQQRAQGWFEVTFVGSRDDREVVTTVRGGDPGYGHTSMMIAEAARCLVEDRDQLPAVFGVLTPAAAMGERLVERLRDTGMTFDVASRR
ncbi:MAG: saccharopine dehydrogenase NADP-binding domain-containing protein [Deltaproteobacteria bacterium]|nr:saccharopine dehydrogenase NADP-binding domain-containing protein [Deltaproteobacteria bacterium]